jgi:hypothetical protein
VLRAVCLSTAAFQSHHSKGGEVYSRRRATAAQPIEAAGVQHHIAALQVVVAEAQPVGMVPRQPRLQRVNLHGRHQSGCLYWWMLACGSQCSNATVIDRQCSPSSGCVVMRGNQQLIEDETAAVAKMGYDGATMTSSGPEVRAPAGS